MKPQYQVGRRQIRALAVAVFLLPISAFAAPAARVEFAFGSVTAEAADGRVRALEKGAAVEEGETVNTNEGRVQLRFADDGFISLYSQTVFRIEEYRWSGVTDGSERGFFRLVKGGLRTVTGMLAKINKKAYRMSTELATIGIRGTEYTMQLNGDLSGTVAEGEIEVCNTGGCLAVAPGQSYYVPDASTRPIFSNKQTMLAPPQPHKERSVLHGKTSDAAHSAGRASGRTDDVVRTRDKRLHATTPQGLIGFTQGAADTLLRGATFDQSPQDMAKSAVDIRTGHTPKLDSASGRVPDTAAAGASVVDAATAVAGKLAQGNNSNGFDSGLGGLKRRF